jgi:hypothetical protein
MIPPATRCGRRLRRRLRPLIAEAASTPGADRYRKHFPACAHLWMLLFHVLDGADSLRQTHGRLEATPGLFLRPGLPQGISRSQFARSSTSRDPACFERLLTRAVALARSRTARDPTRRALTKVQAVDGTFLRLTAKLSPWGQHGGHAAGIRLHAGLDLAGLIPAEFAQTLANTHDAAAFDQRDLAPLRGWTLLMDRGYYGHARFARLREAGVSFLCPLHAQASYEVTAAHRVPDAPTAAGDVVLADEEITLGSPRNHAGAVLPGLRLVTGRNAAGVVRRFVTDRRDLTAAEVVALYRKRWQIELFFRWLKRQLKATHLFGTSREAVWLTVVVCAIVAVLLRLVEAERPPGKSHVEWLRGVGTAVHDALLDPG